jgi:hypothetical protein
MARGRLNKERWIQFYLDLWIDLFKLKGWRISWELESVVYSDRGEEVVAESEYVYEYRTAKVRFNRRLLRNKQQIERAVNHELSHYKFGKGARNRDEDIVFNRLDLILVSIRRRLRYAVAD